MRRVIRLTESDIRRVVKRVLVEQTKIIGGSTYEIIDGSLWKHDSDGTWSQMATPPEGTTSLDGYDPTTNTWEKVVTPKPSNTDCCKSCNCWRDCGGETYYNGENGKPKFTIDRSESNFTIKYEGPNSGVLIKHGKCGTGDTIHQVCNVLTSEINKYLKGKGLKPDIENIIMDRSNKKFTISVPLEKSENGESYKLERRGGMGHEPGPEPVKNKYAAIGGFEGPVKHSSGGITEYFVTFYQ